MAKSTKDLLNRLSLYPDYKDQIKILREVLGITQEELAKRVDRTPRSIRTIENGEAFPRISTLQRIAHALNAELKISLIPETKIGNTGLLNDHEETDQEAGESPGFSLDEEKGFIIGETD
jgi:transcriptional regulator with XRE-family HTH domain